MPGNRVGAQPAWDRRGERGQGTVKDIAEVCPGEDFQKSHIHFSDFMV